MQAHPGKERIVGITIMGTGKYLPGRIVENDEFTNFIDTSDEWIVSHTGISRRRIAGDETVGYMAGEAAKQALETAGIDAQDIDIIIGTTVTPDYYFPSMACLAQNAIGNTTAFAYDIAAACSGFVVALDLAERYLRTGAAKHVLIVSSEMLSQVTDYTDRASCILFGDAAAACVVAASSNMFSSFIRSDTSGGKHLYARHSRRPTPFFDKLPGTENDQFMPDRYGTTSMDGHEVYRWATKAMPEAVLAACTKADIAPEALDVIIPHQANIRIIKTAARNLHLPMDKMYVNIHNYGNTSSATIPTCIDECVRSGRIKRGDKVCITGFGSGLIAGACVFEY